MGRFSVAQLEAYAALGWRLFPTYAIVEVDGEAVSCECGPSCQRRNWGKHPRVDHWPQVATTDVDQLRAWAETWPDANWAVATGVGSGLVVIDCDLKVDAETGEEVDGWVEWNNWLQGYGFDLPPTALARTGRGGRHVFCRYPDLPADQRVPSVSGWGRAGPGVDIRGEPGYVLLAPSQNAGGEYVWLDTSPPFVVPDWLAGELASARGRGRGGSRSNGDGTRVAGYDFEALRRSGEPPPDGCRDDFFNDYAYWARKAGHDRATTEAHLLDLWQRLVQPADDYLPWSTVLEKVDRKWREHEPDPELAADLRDWAAAPGGGGGGGETGPDEAHLGEKTTDSGNAERFARYLGTGVRYCPELGWLAWTTRGWQPRSTDEVLGATKRVVARMWRETPGQEDVERWARWCLQSESQGKRQAMLSLAQGEPGVVTRWEDWDRDPLVLRVGNGLVDLETGKLRELDRGQLISRGTDVDYDPAATSSLLDHFIGSVTGGDRDLEAYLWRAVGYTLTGLCDEEVFFIVYGPLASGKSTFAEGLQTCLGTLAGMASQQLLLAGTRGNAVQNQLAGFRGRRLMLTVELSEGDRLNVGQLKQMTGRDRVTAEFKYRDPFEFTPEFKLWIATNHAPVVDDDATWRRLRRIPFPRTVPVGERDPRIKTRLRDPGSAEARAFLARAVRGCAEWRREGLGSCLAVDLDTEAYRLDDDLLGHFLEEHIQVVAGGEIRLDEMYQRYRAWAESEGLRRPLSMTRLNRKLDPKLLDRGVRRFVSHGRRGWEGAQLRALNRYGLLE